MEKQFLKRTTKTGIVLLAVLSAVAIIATIMIAVAANLGSAKLTVIFTFSAVMLAVASVWNGVLQIRVFSDFKGQRKSLCAEGIFSICLTALIVITYMLFSSLQLSKILETGKLDGSLLDLRWFIGIFIMAFAIWKVFSIIQAFKEKRENFILEILLGVLWLALAIFVFVSMATTKSIILLMTINCLLLVVLISLYNLISYIYKTPKYLITESAIAILEKEQNERAGRLARFHNMQGTLSAEPVKEVKETKEDNIEDKLKKLEDLKEKGLITQEEYEEKRKDVIDNL